MAASLGIGALQAAETRRATFNLPFEAYWGGVLLSPGEYSMLIPIGPYWPQVVTLSAHGRAVFVLAGNESVEPLSQRSYLQLSKVDGTYVVDAFKSGVLGKELRFQRPKTVRRQTASSVMENTKVAVAVRN
jgi:hypothetical protein